MADVSALLTVIRNTASIVIMQMAAAVMIAQRTGRDTGKGGEKTTGLHTGIYQKGQKKSKRQKLMDRISVTDWWDIFTFYMGENRIECPDCEEISPELRDIFQAVQWVEAHLILCQA